MTKDVAEAVERLSGYAGVLENGGCGDWSLYDPTADLRLLLTTLSTREAELAAAREALVAHNDVLRSAFSAAQRDAIHDVRGTTNYRTLADRALDVLNAHHKTTNAARQTLGDQS